MKMRHLTKQDSVKEERAEVLLKQVDGALEHQHFFFPLCLATTDVAITAQMTMTTITILATLIIFIFSFFNFKQKYNGKTEEICLET